MARAIVMEVREGSPSRETKESSKRSQSKPVAAAKLPDQVPHWDAYPELVTLGFASLVERRTLLKDEIDFRKKKMDDLDTEIQALLAVAGAEKVVWEDRPVQIVHSNSGAKINAEKLLMAGVPAQTIAEATVEGKPYSYLLVGKVSQK